ncbi:MAG TPA: hypothetical protein DHW82_06255 [Spirochaetia bacterium]|nr:MAG: hypothetical protein A2Y41_01330 [Spirochaetes bacterium GWB1_36_13]HCL56595.1 hypothetical protein [Spirochaetia bacterium]
MNQKKFLVIFLFLPLFSFGFEYSKIEGYLDNSSHEERIINSYIQDIKRELNQNQVKGLENSENYEARITSADLITETIKNKSLDEHFNQVQIANNELVQFFIEYYSTVGKEFLVRSIKRMENYYPIVKKYLQDNDMPLEMSVLGIIESGYMVRAVSQKGAVGIWQLMPETAAIYGIKMNTLIDERIDVEKSTKAAVLFMKSLAETFNKNWDLVIAAYNGGGTYINSLIRKYKESDFWKLCKINGFKSETLEFVPRFYAVLYILKNASKYGIDISFMDSKPVFESVVFYDNIDFQFISKYTSLPMDVLNELNPHLKKNQTVSNSNLYIPYKSGEMVKSKVNAVLSYKENVKKRLLAKKKTAKNYKIVKKLDYKKYKIQKGDTLYKIAKFYGISVTQLRKINGLKNNVVKVGQVLIVPVNTSISKAESPKNKKSLKKESFVYKIKKGDTLYSLAEKFDINIKVLAKYNNISSKKLLVTGQKLMIPKDES